jgi:DNA-binding NarL/FixJ family response regulator
MKILIADDHPFTLIGTKTFVESLGYQIQATCHNGIAAFNLIKVHQPPIAILDINMPGLTGIEILSNIMKDKIRTKVILLTMHKELSIFKKADELGVAGYILKEHAQIELEKCLLEIQAGRQFISSELKKELIHDTNKDGIDYQPFTLTEKKILELISQQKTSKQIANLLFISEKTVEGHRSNIIQKLNLPKEKNVLLMWVMNHKRALIIDK